MSAARWGLASRGALLLVVVTLVADAVLLQRAFAPIHGVTPLRTPAVAFPAADELRRTLVSDDSDDALPDPFAADREAIGRGEPYADAGDPSESAAAPLLLGTVIAPGRLALAVCQAVGQAPQAVHVGERFGTLTLVAVEPARAVFRRSDGRRVTLEIPKPGA